MTKCVKRITKCVTQQMKRGSKMYLWKFGVLEARALCNEPKKMSEQTL